MPWTDHVYSTLTMFTPHMVGFNLFSKLDARVESVLKQMTIVVECGSSKI